MKKALAIGLSLTMAFGMLSLTGCGSKPAAPYNYDLSEYVTLGEYKGLELDELPEIEITQEEVDGEIQAKLNAAATTEQVKEGVVENGDTLNIDYAGTMDGKAFDGGTAQGASLEIGSGSFIEGFESGLIGAAVGDTVVLDLKFPEPYTVNPDYSGKPCQFTVTINSKEVKKLPEYNDEFAKSQGYDSVADMEKSVREELDAKAKENASYAREEQAWSLISDASEVKKYPEKELAEIKKEYSDYMDTYLTTYGMSKEDYMSANNMTQEDLDAQITNYAESVCKNEMVLYAIAAENGITVSGDEYSERVKKLIEDQGYESASSFKKQMGQSFEEYVGSRNIYTSVLLDKVMEFIIENRAK
ncbi:MAG: trigger factor [Firmicutes bacterium]|nr:trigger factor [Bacillota bacterium]